MLTSVRPIDLLRDWKRICVQREDPGRFALWRTHVALAARDHRRHEAGEAKVLDYRVAYLDYLNLVHLYREIFVGGIYDLPISSPTPLIFDCGSNIGMSILFFKRRHPNARVVGFEPHPQVHDTLRRNVLGNRLADVTLHQKALAGEAGSIEFYAEGTAPGALDMGLFATRNRGAAILVEAETLSSHLHEPVDLLKLDIEGAEEGVLDELARSGRLQDIRNIVCEYHHHLDPAQDRLSRTLSILEKGGFGYHIGAHAPRPLTMAGYQDVVIYAYRKN